MIDRSEARLSVLKTVWQSYRSQEQGLNIILHPCHHPVMDYTSIMQRLELVQNEAARIILHAPRWMKIFNLWPLRFLVKVIQVPLESFLGHYLLWHLKVNHKFANRSWLFYTAICWYAFSSRKQSGPCILK